MGTKISALPAANSIDASADYMPIVQSSTTNKINRNTLLGLASAPLGTTDSQSPTNKTFDNTNVITIKDDNFTLQNSSSVTKQAKFSTASVTAGQTRTITIPDASLTMVGTATTQTLTSKTLTSPVINGGTIDNSTITVDSIGEHTADNGVTVDGLNIHNGALNTNNSVVTANITNAAVTADKLGTGAAASVVTTSETTASTSYTDLATSQAVTVTVGANGMLLVCYTAEGSNSGANNTRIAYALSGANTYAASDNDSILIGGNIAASPQRYGATRLHTGLTPGSTTVTMQFRVTAGTGTFLLRTLSVVPL